MSYMTLKEMKAMEGVEFTYIYSNGDTIPAYIKKFDPKIGLSAFTLATKTRDGWASLKTVKEDGTWCCASYNLKNRVGKDRTDTLKRISKFLTQIKNTGKYQVVRRPYAGGLVTCAFL